MKPGRVQVPTLLSMVHTIASAHLQYGEQVPHVLLLAASAFCVVHKMVATSCKCKTIFVKSSPGGSAVDTSKVMQQHTPSAQLTCGQRIHAYLQLLCCACCCLDEICEVEYSFYQHGCMVILFSRTQDLENCWPLANLRTVQILAV